MLDQKAEILVDVTTDYQRVTFAQLPDYGKCLFLDGDLQSAESDQDIYHSQLVNPAFRYNPHIHRALILGGGEGATAKKILNHFGVEQVTMVDIDQQLVRLCQKHLPEWSQGAFDDPRLTIHFQDAAEFIKHPLYEYDLAIWDLTDPYRWQDQKGTPATSLYSVEFFELLSHHLVKGGLLSVEYATRNRALMGKLLSNWDRILKREMFIPSFEEKWDFALYQRAA